MARRHPILKPALWALAVAALVAGGCSKLISAPLFLPEKPLHPADAIVVLGSGPPVNEEGKPTDELMRRVEKGVELYQQGLAPVLIMSGGKTSPEYYECAVMKQVAVAQGVPAQAVLEERESLNTIGNARYSAALLRARGGKSAIIVSSPFHLKRAKRLFEATGLEIQTAGCKVPDSARYAIGFSIYEYLARVKYLFIDDLAEVRGGKEDARTSPVKPPAPMPAGAAP